MSIFPRLTATSLGDTLTEHITILREYAVYALDFHHHSLLIAQFDMPPRASSAVVPLIIQRGEDALIEIST